MLTNEHDPTLRRLTDRIERDLVDGTGWYRLGQVMVNVGQLSKAEELYLILLQQGPTEQDQAVYLHSWGIDTLITKGLQTITNKRFQSTRRQFLQLLVRWPMITHEIGLVYEKMGDYSLALA